MATPPSMAVFLLTRLVPASEEVVGDLVEEYRAGRSRVWFWRQAMSAIAIGTATSVRARRLSAALAILLGILMSKVGDIGSTRLLTSVGFWTPSAWLITSSVLLALEQFAIGLVIGRLFRPAGPAVALAYAATLVVLLATLQTSWLVGGDVAAFGGRFRIASQFAAFHGIIVVSVLAGAVTATSSTFAGARLRRRT